MKIYQLNSSLSFGDAISNHTFEVDKVLKGWGFDTYVFSETIDDYSIRHNAQIDKKYKKFANSKNDLLIFRYSIYCENINLYKMSNNIKILEYHNITPQNFFLGYDKNLYNMCKKGRDELKKLNACNFSLGVSEYNRMELIENGFDESTSDVVPIFLNYDDFNSIDINFKLVDKYDDGYVNILFVGRVSPNKRIDDVIKTFYIYNKYINQKSRLFIVGTRFLEIYNNELDELVVRLKLRNIYFTNKVSPSDLKTYYRLADIFLCMSEHEGFCVPLLECMYFKVPIIAYNSTAIPYTLKNAGVLINSKSYIEIAELIDVIVNDKRLQGQIIRAQTSRLSDFSRQNAEKKLRIIIDRATS